MNKANIVQKKTALITGASGGIGKAIAECFARDGVNLVITARKLADIQALAQQWQQQYRVQVLPIAAELGKIGGAQALFEALMSKDIALDYLVNNAGVGLFGEFKSCELEAELAMMTLNMTTPTVLTKLCLPQLIARQGKIMNVASTAAFQPGPYMSVYYASKAYVLSWSEALAEELHASGVTVTALCPGPTQSGFQDKAAMNDSALVRGKKLPSAESVGKAGYGAMQRGTRVYVPGLMNKIMVQSLRFTPRALVTRLVRMMSAPTR
jgi:uncharacterized protein